MQPRELPPRRGKHITADPILPILNTGGFWDIVCGDYEMGPYGQMVLMGGLSYMTGFAGPGNTFKSVLLYDMELSVMNNYPVAQAGHYDTEISAKASRPQKLSRFYSRLKEIDNIIYDDKVNPTGQFQIQSAKDMLLDLWWSLFCDQMEEKQKQAAKEVKSKDPEVLLTLPVRLPSFDIDGSLLRCVVPDVFGIDSFSNAETAAVKAMQDEHDIGAAKRGMEFMRGGLGKTQMMMEMPIHCARGGGFVGMVAHLGKEFMQDPKAPPQKQLAFLKGGMKFKNVPEKFSFMVNNCWLAMSATPYWVDSTARSPMYPRNSDDKTKDDSDMMVVNLANLRGKSGGSGMPLQIVVSQSEGVKHGLTMLDFCKKFGRYGLDDNVQNYFLHLRPDVKLSRTVVRAKFEADELLYNAMKITWEMAFSRFALHNLPEKYRMVTPQELYDKLKADGYDWDILLDTTPNSSFMEYPSAKPFLSTRDLLNMYHGEYHPYWLGDDKKTVNWPYVPSKAKKK